jgi:hypothetical protein
MIGKHFLVADSANLKLRRHFTIANCMQSSVYDKLVGFTEVGVAASPQKNK